MAETAKNVLAVQETWVRSVSHKAMLSVSCVHDGKPGVLQSTGLQTVGHN